MRLKVISNGDPHGTKVVNADTGEALVGVWFIGWEIQGNDLASTTIKIYREGCSFDLHSEQVSIDILDVDELFGEKS